MLFVGAYKSAETDGPRQDSSIELEMPQFSPAVVKLKRAWQANGHAIPHLWAMTTAWNIRWCESVLMLESWCLQRLDGQKEGQPYFPWCGLQVLGSDLCCPLTGYQGLCLILANICQYGIKSATQGIAFPLIYRFISTIMRLWKPV